MAAQAPSNPACAGSVRCRRDCRLPCGHRARPLPMPKSSCCDRGILGISYPWRAGKQCRRREARQKDPAEHWRVWSLRPARGSGFGNPAATPPQTARRKGFRIRPRAGRSDRGSLTAGQWPRVAVVPARPNNPSRDARRRRPKLTAHVDPQISAMDRRRTS
jgi:hypothetical protein